MNHGHLSISKKNFQMQVDASDYGIGSVLFQEDGIIGYYSQKLTTAQRNYPISEKEGYAVIRSLMHFRNIIFGNKIIVETDHSNLLHIKDASVQRLQRWNLLCSEFDLEIKYIKKDIKREKEK